MGSPVETNSDSYVIERAGNPHFPEILRFLNEHYTEEETMAKSMRAITDLTEEDKLSIKSDHDRLAKVFFDHSPCLIAIHKESGKIVGVNLTYLNKNPKFFDEPDELAAVCNPDRQKSSFKQEYFKYLGDIFEEADLFSKFPRSKIGLEFYAVAVDKNHRRKGLCRMLMAEGISLARTLQDVGFVYGGYTSSYSRKAAEKLGLKSLLDVDLLKYKNEKGESIFRNTPPHNVLSVMAMEI